MSDNHLLFFAHGMQVEVPQGTVLCFNPLSSLLSPDQLSALPDIQVCVGGITFQTKKAVLDNASPSFFDALHSFESLTGHHHNNEDDISVVVESGIPMIMIEDSEGVEFFPLLFDYLRRKFDHDLRQRANNDNDNTLVVMPYIRDLSRAQLHSFRLFCDCLVPGIFHDDHTANNDVLIGCLDMTEENKMAQLLTQKEFFGENPHYSNNKMPLIDSIRSNDLDIFRFLLLNHINRLSFERQQIEHDLLWIFCILDVTKERLDMLMTVFDPNQFGGRFFYTPENQMPNLFTDLARINRRPMIPITGPERSVKNRFHHVS